MGCVRRAALVLAFAFAALLPAGRADGQQIPIMGCRAATSCVGPRGFSTALQSAGYGNTFFSVGFSVADGNMRWRVVRPPAVEFDLDERAVDAAVDIFVRRTPLKTPSAEGRRVTPPQRRDDRSADPR